MMKSVLAMLLVAAVSTAVAQTATAPSQTPPPSGTAPAPAQQKKEIKDPAEYNAYMGAVSQQDVNAKVSGLEAFNTQYPNSVMHEDALELLMTAYQQAGNDAKAIEVGQKVLQVNSCNIRALAIITFTKQKMATGPNAVQNLNDAGQTAEKGLQCLPTAPKPEGTPQADWDKLKMTAAGIFNNACGMAAYASKDYAKAEKCLNAGVAADPTNLTEIYYLGLADLAPGSSENDPEGLFYIARAADLQSGPGKAQIADFGRKKYKNYHGSEDGWTDLMASANSATAPPPDLAQKVTKYVPPTPAQQCADLLKSKKVEEMAFAEWQLCLSEGNQPDADTVWNTLKGKPLQMVAQVISIDSPKQLKLAGSEDDIEKKTADIDLSFAAAIPLKDRPKEGAELQFEGTPVSYTPKPFVMTMSDGALLVKAKPAPAHKKPSGQ